MALMLLFIQGYYLHQLLPTVTPAFATFTIVKLGVQFVYFGSLSLVLTLKCFVCLRICHTALPLAFN
jgi:hypothetical protein